LFLGDLLVLLPLEVPQITRALSSLLFQTEETIITALNCHLSAATIFDFVQVYSHFYPAGDENFEYLTAYLSEIVLVDTDFASSSPPVVVCISSTFPAMWGLG